MIPKKTLRLKSKSKHGYSSRHEAKIRHRSELRNGKLKETENRPSSSDVNYPSTRIDLNHERLPQNHNSFVNEYYVDTIKRPKKQRLDSSDDIINVKNEPNEEVDLEKHNGNGQRAHYKEQRPEHKQPYHPDPLQKPVFKEKPENE